MISQNSGAARSQSVRDTIKIDPVIEPAIYAVARAFEWQWPQSCSEALGRLNHVCSLVNKGTTQAIGYTTLGKIENRLNLTMVRALQGEHYKINLHIFKDDKHVFHYSDGVITTGPMPDAIVAALSQRIANGEDITFIQIGEVQLTPGVFFPSYPIKTITSLDQLTTMNGTVDKITRTKIELDIRPVPWAKLRRKMITLVANYRG